MENFGSEKGFEYTDIKQLEMLLSEKFERLFEADRDHQNMIISASCDSVELALSGDDQDSDGDSRVSERASVDSRKRVSNLFDDLTSFLANVLAEYGLSDQKINDIYYAAYYKADAKFLPGSKNKYDQHARIWKEVALKLSKNLASQFEKKILLNEPVAHEIREELNRFMPGVDKY